MISAGACWEAEKNMGWKKALLSEHSEKETGKMKNLQWLGMILDFIKQDLLINPCLPG